MRVSEWSSDVCSSDLAARVVAQIQDDALERRLVVLVELVQSLSPQFAGDRKRVVQGKSVSVRVDLGGRRSTKQTITISLTPPQQYEHILITRHNNTLQLAT